MERAKEEEAGGEIKTPGLLGEGRDRGLRQPRAVGPGNEAKQKLRPRREGGG